MTINRLLYRYLFYLLLLLWPGFHTQSAAAESGEYQVKTAMIYNMIRFMDWPEEALPASASQFTICVAGKGSLGTAVDNLQGKRVKSKTVVVHQNTLSNSVNSCQVLVLSGLDTTATLGLLERTRSIAVLTVADSPGFVRSGGTVEFVLQNSKVRFEINQAAAQRHRIRISAQLLKLAQNVQEAP